MIEYNQFCPISKAAEIFGEKWTLLIIRDLVLGATRFNQFQRSIPMISPTVLNKRLSDLEARGVLVRKRMPNQRGHEYLLTQSGRELLPLILKMAEWGMRWARNEMSDDELDVELLMGDIQRRIDVSKLPDGRTLLRFKYTDLENFSDWWLKVEDGEVEVCLDDEGHDVDVYFTSDLRTMTEVWMGDLSLSRAQEEGRLKIVGPSAYLRNLRAWFPRHLYADIRPAQSPAPRH